MSRNDRLTERFEELAACVVAPLVLGGQVRPVRPLGARLALTLGAGRRILDVDLRMQVDVARVRVARLIAPIDTLGDLTAADWALAAALNDLLQLTNHELGGALTRGRYPRLLVSVRDLCEHIPAPRNIAEALSRHATFARALECRRTDTTVSWWTGRASFRGQPPPARLLRWQRLRNVHLDTQRVALTDMHIGIPSITPAEYAEAIALWLSRSPLTDVATATRRTPGFAWSPATMSLLAAAPGRTLAHRLLLRQPRDLAIAVLTRAAKEIPPRFAPARALAEAFASEVAAGAKLLDERSSDRAVPPEGDGGERPPGPDPPGPGSQTQVGIPDPG